VALYLGAFGAAHLLEVNVFLPVVVLDLLMHLVANFDCARDRAGARFDFPRYVLADVALPCFVFEALAKPVRLYAAVDRIDYYSQ
jgi:hypothetical protein